MGGGSIQILDESATERDDGGGSINGDRCE